MAPFGLETVGDEALRPTKLAGRRSTDLPDGRGYLTRKAPVALPNVERIAAGGLVWPVWDAAGIFSWYGWTRRKRMGPRDPRIDAYIAKSADFAKPILVHLREAVHAGCPGCEETMKWSMPHFMYNGMLCAMAAHKQHCSFGFWKGSLVLEDVKKEGMGHLGTIRSIADLPPKKVLVAYVKKAAKLNEDGVEVKRTPRPAKKPLPVPDDLAAALGRSKSARATFEAFSPSHRREYIEWITEARTDATRVRRLVTAIEWMEQGKARNWKYQK